MSAEQIQQIVINAMASNTRVGAGPAARDRHAKSRRTVPSRVGQEVPQPLAKSRQEAGLCIKCGITKYEPGGKGHNSRTCQLPVDKTTSAVDGRKKAGF